MQINTKPQNSTFGMALFMPEKSKIEKTLNKHAAIEAENARPYLKALATNVDIYVTPKHSFRSLNDFHLHYLITNVGKNKFDRFLKRCQVNTIGDVYVTPIKKTMEPLSVRLVDAIASSKKYFVAIAK